MLQPCLRHWRIPKKIFPFQTHERILQPKRLPGRIPLFHVRRTPLEIPKI
jgi:hypothetical protein